MQLPLYVIVGICRQLSTGPVEHVAVCTCMHLYACVGNCRHLSAYGSLLDQYEQFGGSYDVLRPVEQDMCV